MTTLLVTIEDFSQFRAITANLDSIKRLDPYIQEAQILDLKPLLGSALYWDFMKNETEDKYALLINGKEYTDPSGRPEYMPGVKPIVCYFAYARFVMANNVTSTPFGMVNKKNDYSDQVQEKTLARLAQEARSTATAYWEEVRKYLDYNRSTYPYWGQSITSQPRKSARVTAVGGNNTDENKSENCTRWH